MYELTPSERRGALVLLLIVMIGTVWDLTRRDPPMAPPLRERPSVAAAGLPAGGQAGAPVTAAAGPMDLNSASAAELDALPGIGPVLAGRIVDHRERHGVFLGVEDLLAVRGIGPRLFERLRPLVMAGRAGRAGRTRGPDSLQIARPRRP